MRKYLYMRYDVNAQEFQQTSVINSFIHNYFVYNSINLINSLFQHTCEWVYSPLGIALDGAIIGQSLPLNETNSDGVVVTFDNPLYVVEDNNTINGVPIYTPL